MSRVARLLASMLLLAALATECLRYRAEHELAHARDAIGQVLRSGDAARAAREMPDLVVRLEHQPDDVRRDLLLGLALILAQRPGDAVAQLEHAVRRRERPELTLNLGRARAAAGDEAGARAAFLRAGWAAPGVLSTLPAPMRATIADEIARRERALEAGEVSGLPPPLD